ncbi:MAG: hypothetical protein JWQ11_3219 [Rhizobacter sp.]|nr:hypothetical protein [Rhizobacter sp.]
MRRSKPNPFGLEGDGSLDRRRFMQAATALGAGMLFPQAFAQGQPLNIGWIRPTTGRLVSSFAPLYVGGLIAVDEINAAGGIMGRPLVRKEEDDEASPAKEPAVAKKLLDGKPLAFIGPVGSSQALASMAFTTPARMPQSTFANAAEMGDGTKYPYHYQCTFNTTTQAEVAVRHLVETMKLRKIAILQENTAFGEQATAASMLVFKKLGITPVATEVYPLTAPDLGSYVGNMRKAGADGVVAWIASVPSAAMAFNAMAQQKWFPMVAGHNGLFIESIFDLVPPEAIKGLYGTGYKSLTWTGDQMPGERQIAYAKKIATYPEAKGSEINVASAPFYDFLMLLKMVIEGEKSFEPEKIKQALDNVKGYKGMLGELSFSPTNHTGISPDQVVLASVASGRDPKSLKVFRQRA